MAGQEPGYPTDDGERNKAPGTDEIATIGGQALTAAEMKTLIERELGKRKEVHQCSVDTLSRIAQTIIDRGGRHVLDTGGVRPDLTLAEVATLGTYQHRSYIEQELWPNGEKTDGRFQVRNGVSRYILPKLFEQARRNIKEINPSDLSVEGGITLASADAVFATTIRDYMCCHDYSVIRTPASEWAEFTAKEVAEKYGHDLISPDLLTEKDEMERHYYTLYRAVYTVR